MPSLIAQISPQRSTQYASLASKLAVHELSLSAVGSHISELAYVSLGGQAYIQFNMEKAPDEPQLKELGMLSMTAYFINWGNSFL